MNAARMLRQARQRARLTQRALARASRVPQPAIARIESGAVVPRVDTLDRLLAACGQALEAAPRLGVGIDRSAIRALLDLTPGARARLAAEEGWNVERALRSARASQGGRTA
jgi:transcriptional regulator with XRE-family HTH domain